MFGQKNLTDLVRGIRSNKKNESQYINQALQEIKDELKTPDPQKKTVAVQKLTYLQMLGYDMSWAAFNVIEVMSQPKFTSKRIGYLAASQSFTEKTEVITLVTNLIRKDMTSANVWDGGVALNCLANICTPDLARDLAADVVSLLNSARPYIRKKACLVLYKIFLKFPDALRPAFPRLKEKLEDPDPAVIAASVNVICELARKNPKNYISLAPTLFKILTSSTNNWVLIKIVKLFANLLPHEPRLGPKLVQPLTNLINNTPAVSLLYECIQTCTIGLAEHLPTMKLCITKLRNFVEDPDQNLKYLGLISLGNIMKIHPKAVAEHRDLVVNCLDDDDITIRLRALDLLEGMVTKKNVMDVVRKLLDQIDKADQLTYKEALIEKIVTICSKNSYAVITDFEWYIIVLIELSRVSGTSHGELLSSQLMDVIIRVQVIRPYGVKHMVSLLRDISSIAENPVKGGNCEVLYSAAWVVGEFIENAEDLLIVLESLLQSRVAQLPAHIQSVYMQSALKVFAAVTSSGAPAQLLEDEEADAGQVDAELVAEATRVLNDRLPLFCQSEHIEVQERAVFAQEIVRLYNELRATGVDLGREISELFDEPLNPVAPKAQKKVPVPEGLDLDSWINEPEPEPVESVFDSKGFEFLSKFDDGTDDERKSVGSVDSMDVKGAPAASKVNRSGPWYLGSEKSISQNNSFEGIPTVTLTSEDLGIKGSLGSSAMSNKDRIRKGKVRRNAPQVTVLKDEDMPPGANDSDEDDKTEKEHNPFANINFNEPLRPEERLPVQQHRITTSAAPVNKLPAEGKKKRVVTKKSAAGKKLKEKPTKKSTAAPAVGALIDFDPIPTATSPPPTQPGFESIAASEAPKKRRVKKSEAAPAKTSAKKTTGAPRKSSTSSAKPPAAAAINSPEPRTTSPKAVPKFKPLCQDENLSIIYEIRVNPKQPKKIMVAFAFKNLSHSTIDSIEFSIPNTMSFKMANEAQAKVPLVLQPGDTNSHNVIFDLSTTQSAQRVSGSIDYSVDGDSQTKDFQLLVPVSSFVLPVKLSKEEFIEVLTQGGPFSLASSQVKLDDDFKNFIITLATLLHVELIIMESAASLYGKTTQGQHVALYVKNNGGVASVDLKCSDQALANSLISEVNSFFPKA